MCCIFSSDPVEDPTGRLKTFQGQNFQTTMMAAPCANCPSSCCWFTCQFIPFTSCCTQYFLRRKVLDGDMSKYSCFQGYSDCCCIRAGSLGEQNCPDCCLCLEACCCNCIAVSASRIYVMEQYNLGSDPCDYRLINFNNCIQALACICNILAMFIPDLREIARIIDCIADCVYHTVSGCMTAQTAYEVDYQKTNFNGQSNIQQPQVAYPVQK
mmetsp:Transcript_16031/g.16148  ORF Transcript_16031/g.16148 Transcript_16031/m.16148 type:complete len:212 (-) Transcript_16031:167-802(-)